ncbi:MAG: GtrA family protein [Beijerinckiaceae bacterium]|nr:GtrA family protein [Beijerinckiaceae bacterium]
MTNSEPPQRHSASTQTGDPQAYGLLRQSAAFLLAGGLGFVISASLTILFTRLFGWSPFAAWFPALAIAIICTWLMNRTWTFRSGDPRKLAELSRYSLVSLASAGVNYAVYAFCLLALGHSGFDVRAVSSIFAASAIGSGIAAAVTFILSRKFAFRGV